MAQNSRCGLVRSTSMNRESETIAPSAPPHVRRHYTVIARRRKAGPADASTVGQAERQIAVFDHDFGDSLAVPGGDRRKRTAMMDGRAESVQRLEMLRHAIAHVLLEAITRMGEPKP